MRNDIPIADRAEPGEEERAFFDRLSPEALPLYGALREKIAAELPDTCLRVQKTQIGLIARRVYGAVSFLPARRRADRADTFITVTFGLAHRADDPRIDQASEPYPNRWTHHVLVERPDEIDGRLMAWLREAHDFALSK